ncbi:MAG: hypothetical protein HRU19_13700 [Pseudobacteriovorax sp.]|nr:hypothetical protein [Pseudobacteriovorax sp.]
MKRTLLIMAVVLSQYSCKQVDDKRSTLDSIVSSDREGETPILTENRSMDSFQTNRTQAAANRSAAIGMLYFLWHCPSLTAPRNIGSILSDAQINTATLGG